MRRFFALQSNSMTPDNSNANILPTIHGFQGTTHFAQHVLQLPDHMWETAAAKYVLYNNDQRVADLRPFGPPMAMRQILFNKWRYTVDLDTNDLLNGFTGLNTNDTECSYLTPCHSLLTTWASHVDPDSSFSLCPFVDRKDFPPTLASSSKWMFNIKGTFEQAQARVATWMVVPRWDKSIFARMYLMTASGPAIILENWIA